MQQGEQQPAQQRIDAKSQFGHADHSARTKSDSGFGHRTPGSIGGKGFRAGQSGNPSGRTLGMAVHASLLDHFKQVHHRDPGTVEAFNLKMAAKLIARSQSPRIPADDAVRAANTVSRLLTSLGLHTKRPVRAKANMPSLAQLRAGLR